MADWTLKRMLSWSESFLSQRGSASPRLDAELLLAEVLSLSRLQLYLQFDRPLMSAELSAYKTLIKRRALHEPVAYILGRKAFHAIDLKVGPEVLVPRPETEWLVDRVLRFLTEEQAPEGPLLDLCTGSGAVALATAFALQDKAAPRPIVAIELSEVALACAQDNARSLELEGAIDWRLGDLFEPLAPQERFAVLASNPPYVRSEIMKSLEPDVRDWEPALALDGGEDGMDLLRRLVSAAPDRLVSGGLFAVELGSPEQGSVIVNALRKVGLQDARFDPIGPGPTGIVSGTAP